MIRRVLVVVWVMALVLFAPSTAWAASSPVGGLACTASGEYDSTVHAAINLCDGLGGGINAGHAWGVAGSTVWLRADVTAPVVVTGYTLEPTTDSPEMAPRAWVFAGSSDGATWTTLDTQANQVSPLGHYAFANTAAYTSFRWTVSANNGGALVYLAEMGLSTGDVLAPPPAAGTPLWTDGMTPAEIVASVGSSLIVFLLGIIAVGTWRR